MNEHQKRELILFIYRHALTINRTEKELWKQVIMNCEEDEMETIMKEAIEYLNHEKIWETIEKWSKVRTIYISEELLLHIKNIKPTDENVWLQLIQLKMKKDTKEGYEEALQLIDTSILSCQSLRIIIKGIKVSLTIQNYQKELEYLTKGEQIDKYHPTLVVYQMRRYRRLNEISSMRELYSTAIKHINHFSVSQQKKVWKEAITFELENNQYGIGKARILLDEWKKKNGSSQEYWIELIAFEKKYGNKESINQIVTKAINECSENGQLYKELIERTPTKQKQSVIRNALELYKDKSTSKEYAHILFSIGLFMYQKKNHNDAKKWFGKTVDVDQTYGDAWIYLYKLELESNKKESDSLLKLIKRCQMNEKKKGVVWNQIKRKNDCLHYSIEEILCKGIELI